MTLINGFSIDEIKRRIQFLRDDFPDLHQAAKYESIIIFAGAGVSKLYGCHLWDEMASNLVKSLKDANIITYAEQDILLKNVTTDPRKVISICFEKCKTDKKLSVYENAIKSSVQIKDKSKAQDIFQKIFSIKATVHITTNIDNGLKDYVSAVKYPGCNIKIYNCTLPDDQERIKQVNYNVLKDGNVFYLHGNTEYILDCILPVENYLSYYNKNNDFLAKLFSKIKSMKGIIIFIGYGLNELDIIERICKIDNYSKERIAYLLSPIFSHEITSFCLDIRYYESFGVEPIPYIIDKDGYETLKLVLGNLAKAIDGNVPSPYEIISEIEEIGKYAE